LQVRADHLGQAEQASETNGGWGQAETVLAGGGLAVRNPVSVATPGTAAAGWDYSYSSGGVTQGPWPSSGTAAGAR
jgi:hypothetical protein